MPGFDVRTGTRLLDYRIEAVLGRGGMGVVYLAEDLRLRRKVALKLLAAELAEDERFRERFLRESELAASIDHPNAIPIYAAGEADGVLYIAMRFVEGTDLRALLLREGSPLEPARALAIVKQVADALDAAHEHGLVHRDVKPANILIAGSVGAEHAYVSDFGVAKSASVSAGLTAAGQFLGTIGYVAPEQIRGEPIDGRADVYSLGCVFFECVTGEAPFPRDSEVAVIYAHLQGPPPKVSERRRGLPVALDAVIARALAKAPDRRYTTCRELVDAVAAALGAAPAPRRRRLAILSLGAALGAAGIVVGLVLVLRPGDRAPRPALGAPPPRYRVSLSEQLTSGAAAATPDLALIAAFDNGRGLRGWGTAPPPQTGQVVFRVDRRQFDSGVYSLLATPLGTRVGYFTLQPGGDSRVQIPLRKVAISTDPATGDKIIRLSQAVAKRYRDVTPVPRQSSILRVTSDALVLTVPLQGIAHRAAKAGIDFSYSWVGVHFFGSFVSLGQRARVVYNPIAPTTFRSSVAARRCADALCTRLGPAARDVAVIRLPRALNVTAPRRAVYGKPTRFRGTGHPGDAVTVAFEPDPRSGPNCTPVNAEHVLDCRPRFRPALRKITERRAVVGPDGTWSLELPLRSSAMSLPDYPGPPGRRAGGRYVAVAYTGKRLHGPVIGGSFSVLAEAPATTVVSLGKPALSVSGRGKRLRVTVAIPGADHFVAIVLRARGATIASGQMTDRGTFAADIVPPRGAVMLVASASAPGATPSRATVALPATA